MAGTDRGIPNPRGEDRFLRRDKLGTGYVVSTGLSSHSLRVRIGDTPPRHCRTSAIPTPAMIRTVRPRHREKSQIALQMC